MAAYKGLLTGPSMSGGVWQVCTVHRPESKHGPATSSTTGLMLLMPILTPMLHAPRVKRPVYAQNDVRFSKRGGAAT